MAAPEARLSKHSQSAAKMAQLVKVFPAKPGPHKFNPKELWGQGCVLTPLGKELTLCNLHTVECVSIEHTSVIKNKTNKTKNKKPLIEVRCSSLYLKAQ